jgi:hypothetical protein
LSSESESLLGVGAGGGGIRQGGCCACRYVGIVWRGRYARGSGTFGTGSLMPMTVKFGLEIGDVEGKLKEKCVLFEGDISGGKDSTGVWIEQAINGG